jgi:hypothetical protein
MLRLFTLLFIIYTGSSCAQDEKKYHVGCIGFYNLENLFDTIDSQTNDDTEFLPGAPNRWDSQKYLHKLDNLATVISQVGTELTPDGLAILGISEIENRGVIEDLIRQPALKDRNYQIVHYDSPDERGVDVGLIYQPKYFTVTGSKSYRLSITGDTAFLSRDQLLVSGTFEGEVMHIIVNHWPSRRGGEKTSRPFRKAAALLCRHITDSLLTLDPAAKIIIMGDLNDDPIDKSLKVHLRASGDPHDVPSSLYNPMEGLYRKGIGSLAYQDSWNLFDQIIVSSGLVGEDKSTYKFHTAKVFNKSFLLQKEGKFAGYPLRTYGGGVYLGGYSDHLPVYIFILKEVKP